MDLIADPDLSSLGALYRRSRKEREWIPKESRGDKLSKCLEPSPIPIRAVCLVLAFISLPSLCQEPQSRPQTDLLSRLRAVKGIYVKRIEPLPGFREGFEIAVIQPVNHADPGGAKFSQRVFLSHRDFARPVVLETEGYGAPWPWERELAKMLEANQVIVEHRYYESSRPKPLRWEHLTTWQAASDHHRIVDIIKTIYPGKWVSTGRSKGGMAALFHRAFYPNDVDATVACVAPVMIGPVDPRFDAFLSSAGDAPFRAAVKQFQKTCLERRRELLPLLKKRVARQKLVFSCALDEILERAVMEFPYSFCFGEHRNDEIPGSHSPAEQVLDCLTTAVPLPGFSTSQLDYNAGLYYQQFTELGYFSYSAPHIEQVLRFAKKPHFEFYVPQGARQAKFNGEAMRQVLDSLRRNGNRVIYLYGEHDIYTACAVELTTGADAIKLIAKGCGHDFGIKDLPEEEKEKIAAKLEDWLQIKFEPQRQK